MMTSGVCSSSMTEEEELLRFAEETEELAWNIVTSIVFSTRSVDNSNLQSCSSGNDEVSDKWHKELLLNELTDFLPWETLLLIWLRFPSLINLVV